MFIDSLHLNNFRNFSSLKILFDKNLTVILGPNGSGKSNILEACGLLATVRSSRVETDLDLVKFGKSETKIEGFFGKNFTPGVESGSHPENTLGVSLERAKLTINFQVVDETYVKKAYFVDEIKRRYIDFSEHFSIIIFEPLDLDLVSGSPSLRRHHLDSLLSSIDRDYWRAFGAYNKVVVRRNKVLWRIQEGHSEPNELDFWDARLLEHGKIVSAKRQEFFEFLNLPAGRQVLFESLSWEFKQSLVSEEKLAKNRDRDIAAGVTLSGPHRDDFIFQIRNSLLRSKTSQSEIRNLEYFGSRGEQRMAVLALKLAELEFVATKKMARPVLALDDIFSELDLEHREAVLEVIGKQQVIITAAEKDSLPKKIFMRAKVVELR